MRRLLTLVFVLTAAIGANSVYLAAVTLIEYLNQASIQNYFYQLMFLVHLLLGLLLILPFLVFATLHIRNARHRPRRRAVWIGYVLFTAALLLMASGILLTRVGPWELRVGWPRQTAYWCHVISPLVVVWLYVLHRLVGPRIKWRRGLAFAVAVGVACGLMILFHPTDPRLGHINADVHAMDRFQPSPARTAAGGLIPSRVLANDAYCLDCHPDTHEGWSESAHRFSSFNNPAYLTSIRETRDFSMQTDGNVHRSRWCAGCHDPVPLFSGEFDNPDFDAEGHPTAHAGITCTVCHAITQVNSQIGNGDYTIEEPAHYPFAFSSNPVLKWVNHQLIKGKPEFHRMTFLKPFHREAEFCSTCHKVHIPEALNDYRFLRGQNHYDAYLLSGVSGHGCRSFYYPDVAAANCSKCHMPLQPSDEFGAQRFANAAEPSVHDHLFVGANTALPHWRQKPEIVKRHQEFLKDCLRIDLFGLRAGGTLDDPLTAPLRPELPALVPGERYLLDAVVRTLTLGHRFTEGTADSNQVWVRIRITDAEGRMVGYSGEVNQRSRVDPWAHFINAFVLDRNGNRIDRRNAQDIFVPLYNHQIPPGAGQTIHYGFQVPEDAASPLDIQAEVLYRKFDSTYLDIINAKRHPTDPPLGLTSSDQPYINDLPITVLATDHLRLPLAGADSEVGNPPSGIPEWQRWNDYGIGSLLKGRAELRQAAEAFSHVERLNRYDGPLNLARVYYSEGRLDEAVAAAERAAACDDPPAPPWTLAWLAGLVNREQGYLAEAADNFRSALDDMNPEMYRRGFNFSLDYEVRNLLGMTLFDLARQKRGQNARQERERLLQTAVDEFQKTLRIDPENVTAHYNLQLLYAALDKPQLQEQHRQRHLEYKPDDNARDRAVAIARKKYPAADHAAEAVVIYDLQRELNLQEDEGP